MFITKELKVQFQYDGLFDFNCYSFFFRMVARKAFPLIQIEEQAVLDLRRAYSADDNPDEYIRVERFQKVKFSNQTLSSWGSTGR